MRRGAGNESCLRLAALLLCGVLGSADIARAFQGAPQTSSSIAVDFSKTVRVIPALLFGLNLQTNARGEGIVEEDGSYDGEILGLLDEVRITTLRYPAGTPADYFHWWQALGPHSSRPAQSTGYIDEAFYKPVIGPEEFIDLSVALRATPFVTANSGTGNAAEAGAFARFFNSKGFPVTFWEVGNEVYFEGIGDNGLVGLPPEVYAKKVIEYASAIRAEAPHAKVFAAAISPDSTGTFWNAVVLGLAGPYIDGLSVHNAYFPLWGYRSNGTVPSDEYLYTAMLGATAVVEASTTALENQLDALGWLIPIFVSEYDGIFFPDPSIEDPAVTFARNQTLATALFNASVLQILARHEKVFGAHKMSLAGTDFGGLIGTDGEVRYRNPQFYVHREYAKEAGKILSEVSLDPKDARFSSGPLKELKAQTGVPMLDAMATRDADGSSFALFVVNRSLATSVNGAISLQVPSDTAGTVSTLTGPSYDSRNDAQNPGRVKLTTTPFSKKTAFSYRFPPHSITIFRWKRGS
jgi:alpha-L-arabinofuranosidase